MNMHMPKVRSQFPINKARLLGLFEYDWIPWLNPSLRQEKYKVIREYHVEYKSKVSQFSCSVVSGSLWPHGLQHARLPCLSPTPGACSNSCPSSWWCHPVISSCCPLLLLPSIFPIIRVFPNESVLCIRWPKYWRKQGNYLKTTELKSQHEEISYWPKMIKFKE